jgi:GT2 family glycosyltransferase
MSAPFQCDTANSQALSAVAPLLASIVISTYRRLDMLRDALQSMRELAVREGLRYEVLIVDNDPAGGARGVVEGLQTDWPPAGALRYIHESRPGLSYARNRGIEEARGEIVAFLDDDIFIDPHWLLEIVDCFARSNADCVGGRTTIYWDGEPEPVVKACEDTLVQGTAGPGEFEVRGAELPGGGNMAVRRSLITAGFRFPHELGRVGKLLLSGEETEALLRLRKAGKRIWYCGAAVMLHRTGGERLAAAYYLRRGYWLGLSYALVDRRCRGKIFQIASALARLVKVLLLAPLWWLAARLRRDDCARVLLQAFLVRQRGYLRATFFPWKVVPRSHGG